MGWIAMATDQTSQSGHVCSIFVSVLFSDWRIWIEKREKGKYFFFQLGSHLLFYWEHIKRKLASPSVDVSSEAENLGIQRVKFLDFIPASRMWFSYYAVKMPGSLSNEDEGQDDMDFEDDVPGEGVKSHRGGRVLPFTTALLRLVECGGKGAWRACDLL